MDVALGLTSSDGHDLAIRVVLILVVMDVALGLHLYSFILPSQMCLNPCCNGCRTWTKS